MLFVEPSVVTSEHSVPNLSLLLAAPLISQMQAYLGCLSACVLPVCLLQLSHYNVQPPGLWKQHDPHLLGSVRLLHSSSCAPLEAVWSAWLAVLLPPLLPPAADDAARPAAAVAAAACVLDLDWVIHTWL